MSDICMAGLADEVSLTFIVPMHNVEKELTKCLDSILDAQLPFLFECILVDDGSTDDTLEIARSYAQRHANIYVFSQVNQGAGAARNTGMQHARGKYLWFVDADDWIVSSAAADLVEEIEREDLDILIFGYEHYDVRLEQNRGMPKRDRAIYASAKMAGRHFSIEEYPEILLAIMYPWNKIYKQSFITDHGTVFPDVFLHEDVFFNVATLCRAKKIKITPDVCYVHRFGGENQATQIMDQRRLIIFSVLRECEEILVKAGVSNDVYFYYSIFKLDLLIWIMQGTRKYHEDAYVELKKKMEGILYAMNESMLIALLHNKHTPDKVIRAIPIMRMGRIKLLQAYAKRYFRRVVPSKKSSILK